MRFAKLEIKFVLALFLVGYDFELVDGNGNFPKEFPTVDRNDLHQVRDCSRFIYSVNIDTSLDFAVERSRRDLLPQVQEAD